MNERRKSDRFVVPRKSPNKAAEPAAEAMEGRSLIKGNPQSTTRPGHSAGPDVLNALERVREAATRDRKQRFTALLHHVYAVERLRRAFGRLKPDAAAGIDGETKRHYGENLETNLRDLSERLRRGAFRANPVRRAYIPKADGRQRPLGVPTLEDKLVQSAVVEVLNAIYEVDFADFSYGFRPGRKQHDALDALAVGIWRKKVSWVLDADIRSFFDTLDHGWLLKFIEHRIADQRVLRLIQKWLKAGVLEEGKRISSEVGTVQGGSISPLLANIYLHYVFDLWTDQWSRRHAGGAVVPVRYADDFVVGFERQADAEKFKTELEARFTKFGLALHPNKTHLLEFGRDAATTRARRGEGKPGTFNFLGFTHICGKTKKGDFTVLRQTMRKRMQAKLTAVAQELRARRHHPLKKQGAYVRSVVGGHVRYYGVPMNSRAIGTFRQQVTRLWWRSLQRRSQRGRLLTWKRMEPIARRWIPPARICHPWPLHRTRVTTRDKSRMR